MQNLEQIRAAAALKVAEKTTKSDVSKLPAMIITNGLLAATAFAKETSDNAKPKREQMKNVMDGVARHLASQGIATGANDASTLIDKLAAAKSTELQRATSEALAFISYVKRFATKEVSDSKG